MTDYSLVQEIALTVGINGKRVKGKLTLEKDYDRDTQHLDPIPDGLDNDMGAYYFYKHSGYCNISDEHLFHGLIEQIEKRCKANLDYAKKWVSFLESKFIVFKNEDTYYEIQFYHEGEKKPYGILMHEGKLNYDFENIDLYDLAYKLSSFEHGIPMIGIEYDQYSASTSEHINQYTQGVLLYVGSLDNPNKEQTIEQMKTIAKSYCTWQQNDIYYIKPTFKTLESPFMEIDIDTDSSDPEIWDDNIDQSEIDTFIEECIDYLKQENFEPERVQVLETA
jgi:hypothetical protein